MRSPSARVLKDVVNIFVAPPGRDTDGGATFPYPGLPTFANVPCTCQPFETTEVEDQDRFTQYTRWRAMFAMPINLNPKDQIVFVDVKGVTHIITVDANRDEASRGAAFSVWGTERQ